MGWAARCGEMAALLRSHFLSIHIYESVGATHAARLRLHTHKCTPEGPLHITSNNTIFISSL